MYIRIITSVVVALAAGVGSIASGQTLRHQRALSANVVLPLCRGCGLPSGATIAVTGVDASVKIVEQVALTTLDIHLANNGGSRLEAELVIPVPDGAVVKGLAFDGPGSTPTAELLPRGEARGIYDALVARIRDPALMEFAGYNLIRTSVFPIDAGQKQRLRVSYEQLLKADGARVDFHLPRSESLDYRVPWTLELDIQGKRPISTVYSPSHVLSTARVSPLRITAKVAGQTPMAVGPVRVSYLVQDRDVSASLLAYPDGKVGGGYFLMLAGLPATPPADAAASKIRRDVTLVIDRSGSMRGEKIEQVREAAIQVIAALGEGEAFNIITYAEATDSFSSGPVIKTSDTLAGAINYLKSIHANGGTNIHAALSETLAKKPGPDMLPIVLFLTDGLPTVGETSEVAIRDVAMKANPYQRRIFTFGVGVDVNTALLDKVASETRAAATFVLPQEDVEVKVAQVFRRLAGPVLADPLLVVRDAAGQDVTDRVYDVLPRQLPDLFEGDQLVLLGQYRGTEALRFELSGNFLGTKRTFRFDFALDNATTRNSFVPRLWASRKIGELVDAIRQLGADQGVNSVADASVSSDPRFRELVDEVVHLSKAFGVLTEYTAFLAREGTNLGDDKLVKAEACDNFLNRAVATRTGMAGCNQDVNRAFQAQQMVVNNDNCYWNDQMERVSEANVMQINDRAFYNRAGRWVDSRLVDAGDEIKPDRVIEFGSDEFRTLAARLVDEGRQACIALSGDILLSIDGKSVLVKAPEKVTAASETSAAPLAGANG
jgi:Ca-activated chloride channel family protein